MVNLYDSPAQAQFINTYVPIQFNNLYGIAEQAQKNLDQSQALEDDNNAKYSSLNTPISADKATWASNVYGPYADFVNKNLTNPDALKDPMVQSQLKSMTRKMQSNPLAANLLASAQAANDFMKKSDPRWGDYERNKVLNHNTATDGVFGETNMPYQDVNEIYKPTLDKLHPEGTDLGTTKNGEYDLNGWTQEHLDKILAPQVETLKSNPVLLAKIDQMDKNGQLNPSYYDTDPNTGQRYLNVDKAVFGLGREVGQDKLFTHKSVNEAWMANYRSGLEWRNTLRKHALDTPEVPPTSLNAQQGIAANNQVSQNSVDAAYNKLIESHYVDGKLVSSYIAKNPDGTSSISVKNPMGKVGSDYAHYRLNLTSSTNKINQLAAEINALGSAGQGVDPSHKQVLLQELSKEQRNNASLQDKFNQVKPAFESLVQSHKFLAENPVQAANAPKSIFSKDDLASMSHVDLAPEYIDGQLQQTLGKGHTVNTKSNINSTVYSVRNSSIFNIVDPSSGRMISAKSNPSSDVARLNGLISAGALSNKSVFEPNGKGMATSSGISGNPKINGLGTLLVSKGDLESRLFPNLAADKGNKASEKELESRISKLKQSGLLSDEQVVRKTDATGAPIVVDDYYRIPSTVSYENPSLEPGTWKAATMDSRVKVTSNQKGYK